MGNHNLICILIHITFDNEVPPLKAIGGTSVRLNSVFNTQQTQISFSKTFSERPNRSAAYPRIARYSSGIIAK